MKISDYGFNTLVNQGHSWHLFCNVWKIFDLLLFKHSLILMLCRILHSSTLYCWRLNLQFKQLTSIFVSIYSLWNWHFFGKLYGVGCKSVIPQEEYLICVLCESKYDLLCANACVLCLILLIKYLIHGTTVNIIKLIQISI